MEKTKRRHSLSNGTEIRARGDGGRTIRVRDAWGNTLWTKVKSCTPDGWTVEDVVRRVEGKVERQRRQGSMRFCLSGPLKHSFDAQGKQERQTEREIYQMDGTKIETDEVSKEMERGRRHSVANDRSRTRFGPGKGRKRK